MSRAIVAVLIFAFIVGVFVLNFYAEKLPFIASLDAKVGCPFYVVPGIGGFLTSFIGCGFLSFFNFLSVIAILIAVVYLIWGE